MDFDWIWKAILIVIGGTLLLRVAGRKSISQMTLAQTVIMIGIGSLLIQPVAGKNVWVTIAVGAVLVFTLVAIEFLQLKFDSVEKFITGKSKILIENGTLNEKNLRKLRLTVDQLEMNLRQQNVATISDIQWATLEPNGQVGFILKPDAQPVTKGEFQQLRQDLQQMSLLLHSLYQAQSNLNIQQPENKTNLFSEVAQNSHDYQPSKHLQ
ncbi:DUF421 domain-containing protein [Lysinibacillus sp. BW-2-10]|uniref:DUF421 domain-containing protein n=1 Tax=Lysinibacillus sp. BW-2-10 TaxID=2590030 RepID=UPI00117FCB0E|nr:DUF421 domain-containing protein [Lysinibacillus sp. BW-2-10]TSI06220.1 DUF421 domain-containing protein [Lysinibacillus sp. BW-2-10]